jgi:hypothetical protein
MKKTYLRAEHIGQAWDILHDVLCGLSGWVYGDDSLGNRRILYSKVRDQVIRGLQDGTRWGDRRCGLLFDAAVSALERQGYVTRAPLDGGPEFEIDLTEEGDLRLFEGEWPEFEDVAVPIDGASAKGLPG